MAKSKELKVETPVVEAKKNTETKKTETKKAEVKQTEAKKEETKMPEVKKAEVKSTAAKNMGAVKAEKEAVKAEAPAEKEAVQTPAEKEAAEAVKKTAAKVKKPAKEKSPVVPSVFVQYQEQQADVAGIIAKAKELYVAQKHRESSIKSLQVYIKPQDGKAYYVINDKITGDLDLF